ncbi:hypothetical protein L227DRAFT_440773 [Lentinus tigrinus ALCF2SS1-6]|uniref:Uncharacterized protein n=1 Tax=Lentinus tigrinus ALCF2SS1-6 TaxID=1328759 RepID=A0A5C2RM94_9APHY|nr:hypothetical protein L227DRAFT_440773 [Lentinus tigrinus ALCF2SS1-6]
MARNYYMDSDNEPSSSEMPSEPECVVRYQGPPPPTQIRTLMEQARKKVDRPPGPSFLDTLCASSVPRVRRPHDRSHPAYARDTPKEVPKEITPSLIEARNEFSKLMGQTIQAISANADRKAAKLSRGASMSSTSKTIQGGISKHKRKHTAPVRREHTSEDVSSAPDVPPAKSRLRSCVTDPDISSNAVVPMDEDEKPVAGPSRPPPLSTFFKSRINEPDYDFPSSTPTPPAKQRVRDCWNPSSSSSSSLSGASLSPLMTPGLLRHERVPGRDPVNLPAWYNERTESSIRQDTSDASMMDDESVVERQPEDHPPEVPPVPYVPLSSLPTSSMLPPPPPAPRQDPIPSRFHPPSLTPVPPLLSRPFVPPSQVPSGSQPERPRPSQRHKALGMRPVYGHNSKFQSKAKPFKVPFAVKKPSGSLSSGSGSGSGTVQGGERRSVSPVVPDPPYVAARALAQEEPSLEMTARRAEPPRMDEDEDEGPQDANSSADMWAALSDIELP